MLGVRQAVLASLPRVAHVSHVSSRSLHVSRLAAAIQLKMPSLSPTMEEGTIVKWAKVCILFLHVSIMLLWSLLRLRERSWPLGTWSVRFRQTRP